tara:strand:+ start:1411 stop:1641 length:231 start_codon:yes stop_codon:yes gene_type:complete
MIVHAQSQVNAPVQKIIVVVSVHVIPVRQSMQLVLVAAIVHAKILTLIPAIGGRYDVRRMHMLYKWGVYLLRNERL